MASMQTWIDTGMRARLKTGSLITGQLLVDIGLHPDKKPILRGDGKYPEIPTIPSKLEEITRSLTALLDKVQALPLDELTTSLTKTVKSAERLIENINQNIAPETQLVLVEANKTLKTVREAIEPASSLRYDLETTLQELSAAARAIRLLAEYLESNPNALIYGKSGRPQK